MTEDESLLELEEIFRAANPKYDLKKEYVVLWMAVNGVSETVFEESYAAYGRYHLTRSEPADEHSTSAAV